jgi:hypothetical protein
MSFFGTIIGFVKAKLLFKNKNMKKTLLFLGIAIFGLGNSYSQKDDKIIEKLRVMYGEEKYQDCAHDAIKYSSDSKLKSNPEIYIYASMACLRISQSNEGVEEFKKAFNDALSYAGKYRKKDNDGLFYNDYLTHFEELKKIVAEEVENYMLEDRKAKVYKSAKKSLGSISKIQKMDPDDKGVYLLNAVLELKVKNTIEGKKMIKVIMPEIQRIAATRDELRDPEELTEKEAAKKNKKIEEIYGSAMKPMKPFDEMTEMEQVFLRLALIEYGEHLFEKKNYDEAKEVMEIGKPYFYKENENYLRKYNVAYKESYDRING